jgi:drug/metabolite transporter (DMT)-like permease
MFTGELAALAAALLWSTSSFVFTEASIRIGSIQLNISRMILAALLLLVTFVVFGIDFSLSNQQVFYLTVSGLVGLSLGDTFLFKAFQSAGPRVSMLLMSFNPAIAAILAFFILNETLSAYSILGMGITLTGISIVILEKPVGENNKFRVTKLGIIYGFLAAAGQGTGLVFAKFAFSFGEIHPLIATFVRIVAAVVMMFPLAVIIKKYKNPFKLFYRDRKSLGLVALGSVIGPYLGITFSFIAVIYTKVGIASTLMATVPILMLPMSKFYYKEKLSWKAILGAFIAVTGVGILFLT